MSDDLFETREKNPQETFTRYNREERLKNASKKVRQLHDPDFIKRKGLIKSLTATRGSRYVFFIIIIFIVLNFGLFFLTADKNKGMIFEIRAELQNFVYDGKILANVTLEQKENMELAETVKIQFTFFDKNNNKIKSFLSESIYTGAELRFFAEDETGNAKKIQADILIKNKFLSLTQKVK